MREPLIVFLFDVDGVLVDAKGYRLAVVKSLEILCSRSGIANVMEILPNDAEIAYMEACGIHDVWDMTNMIFAAILCQVAINFQQKDASIQLADATASQSLASIKAAAPQVSRLDYRQFVDKLLKLKGSTHPPDLALQLLSQEIEIHVKHNNASKWQTLLNQFLVGTRSVFTSYGTKVFQNVILGSSKFVETYRLASEYNGQSLLLSEDKVLISLESVKMLRSLSSRVGCGDCFKVAIYTARPSLPPPGEDRFGYSPEAEMAVEAAGMNTFPLVAMGTMQWLALRHAERTEDLTKPNTTQAVNALLAAMTGDSSGDLSEKAYLFDKKNSDNDDLLAVLKDRQTKVFVFEDTISGIKPMIRLAETLKSRGIDIKLIPIGITGERSKGEALAKCCVTVVADVNEAIEFALNETKMSSEAII
jgi:hypothetical protein